MFSTTIKRSAATLGVAAGLLAAAGPASAMPAGVSPGDSNDALSLKAGASEVLMETVTGKTDVPDALSIATSEVFELNTLRGTQVGSEGIWAPGDGSDYIWAPGDGSDFVKGNNGPPAR